MFCQCFDSMILRVGNLFAHRPGNCRVVDCVSDAVAHSRFAQIQKKGQIDEQNLRFITFWMFNTDNTGSL